MWKQSIKVKKIKLAKRHVNYLDSVREELIKAEEIVDRIKGCDEWKKARNYFGTCFMRGLIKARPSKENGYKIEIESPKRKVVQIEELKDIVTEEQMEEIKKLLNG